MKKIISIMVAVLLAVFSSLCASAVPITPKDYPDFQFELDWDDTYKVYDYSGSASEVTVPQYVYDKLVKRVDEKGFYSKTSIVSLSFHDKMSVVWDWGVRGCQNLENVYYSKSFDIFHDYAFAYNPKLSSALLGNTQLTTLSLGSYSNCTALKYAAFPSTLTTLGSSAFMKTALKTVVLPSGVKEIGDKCFYNIGTLQKVYVPDTVETIGSNAFGRTSVTVYTNSELVRQYCEDNNVNCESVSSYPVILSGDVNFDGVVDAADVEAMSDELGGKEPDFNANNCDINGDCRFNVDDVTALQKQLEKEYTFEYTYKTYDEADKYETVKIDKSVKTWSSDFEELAKENMPKIRNPYVTYSIGSVSVDGDVVRVAINDAPRYYTVSVDGKEEEYRYLDVATVSSDTDKFFIVNGKRAAYGTAYSFYVTCNTEITTETETDIKRENIATIDFSSFAITNEKITIELFAGADVDSFSRMGVAFSNKEQTAESLTDAINAVQSGTDMSGKIVVHNSSVTKANRSGQYQFIYAPYLKTVNAKYGKYFFYTYAVTENGDVIISEVASVSLEDILK